MRTESKKVIKTALIILIALNLAFIFIQSLIPVEQSSKESNAVGEIVESIIPSDTKPGNFIQMNLRKIAHFIEFASLGILVSLYLILFVRKRAYIVLSFPSALAVGFIDETIQLFSNRGASISDVWIDFFGFASASVIVYTGHAIYKLIRDNVNESCHESEME